MSNEDQTYKPEEAAAYLGLSQFTLSTWRSLKKGPAYIKIGNRVRYQKRDLDAFLETNRKAHPVVGAEITD